jgi:Long-chain acyl-CoA synthetases (AMP-forming)
MSTNVSELPRAAQRVFTGRGTPLFPDEPSTLPELFMQAVAKYDRADALNYKKDGQWQKISSTELISRTENIALGLYSLGLRNGDAAAILAANSPEWTLADAGCQFIGVIDVPIYTTLAPASIQYIINDSEARLFFIQNREAFESIRGVLGECKTLEKLVFFDAVGVDAENAISLGDLEKLGVELRKEQPDLIAQLSNAIKSDDVATLIYTSGTTGEPKGVMLSHTNIISNVIDAGEKYNFVGDDVSLSVLPLCHIFERTGMYLYILNGMAVHYAESIERVPDNLQEVRPTLFIGVPRIFEKVYARARLKAARSSRLRESVFDWAIETAKDYAYKKETGQSISATLAAKHSIADRLVYSKFREFFGGRLRYCITGGAALSDDIWLIFTGSGVSIMQGYGLTETSPVISSNNPFAARLGTVGKTIRNVNIRIAGDGEIEVKSPGVMLGYYKKDHQTTEAFTSDGWFRTGDLGTIDDDGFLRITDRKKELFKTSGGKYIAPSPIEQMIRASRFVSQVVLVGNERKFPAALIVPNFEQLESYAHLKGLGLKTPREFCRNQRIIDLIERQIAGLTESLSGYEKVKKIVLLEKELTVESGELTPTLKVKRRVIDEKYCAVIDKIYSDAEKDRKAPALNV